jgi:SAM-dependent methyltransferase
MSRFLSPGARIVEVGCGTGWMVTLPLRRRGFDIIGIDIDAESIEYGQRLFTASGLDPTLLSAARIEDLRGPYDAFVISEVLEHLPDVVGEDMLHAARQKLIPGGMLLVTVPNGRGWYELESFLWNRTPLGAVLQKTGIAPLIRRLRQPLASGPTRDRVPSTLSYSPHVQRFSFASIQHRIEAAGFEVIAARGSVLLCGPFTELLLTGSKVAQAINLRLGERFSQYASAFFIAAQRPA